MQIYIKNVQNLVNHLNKTNKLDPSVITSYEKGKLSLVFDTDKWTYKPIN